MAASPLRDRRILIVEDEYLVAMSLRELLETVGSVVIGPVSSIKRAFEAIKSETGIDVAIVDINLGGVMAYPVADLLLARSIPFVFTSGYGENVFRDRYPQIRYCLKPCAFPKLEQTLASAITDQKPLGANSQS